MILGKSNHPIEIKKVRVKIWTLRSEIELHLNKISSIIDEKEKTQKLEKLKRYFKLIEKNSQGEVIDAGFSGSMNDDEFAKMAESIETEDEENKPEGEQVEASEASESEAEIEEEDEEDNVVSLYPKGIELIERQSPLNAGMGFVFLSDLNMNDGLLFSSEKFTIGQTVVIEFLVPKRFFISSTVTYCRNLDNNTKIISETKPKFRVCFENILSYPAERTNLRNFLKSIEPTIPLEPMRPMTSSDSDDEDHDDLDELADFGF